MANKAKKIENFLELLELHCELCDVWDEHRAQKFADEEARKSNHLRIQREECMPVMEVCNKYGYKYVDLVMVIPPTLSSKKRWRMFDDLRDWATEEYDLPPFDT